MEINMIHEYYADSNRTEGQVGGLAQNDNGYLYLHHECGRMTFYPYGCGLTISQMTCKHCQEKE